MKSGTSFYKLFICICIFTVFSGAVILVPLGIFLSGLPCLFLEIVGFFLSAIGLFFSVCLLRVSSGLFLR